MVFPLSSLRPMTKAHVTIAQDHACDKCTITDGSSGSELDGLEISPRQRDCIGTRSHTSNVSRYAGDQKSLRKFEAVLRKAGVDFIDENGGGPGVRLRKPARDKPRK